MDFRILTASKQMPVWLLWLSVLMIRATPTYSEIRLPALIGDQFVHDHESQRTIGAMHGIGPTRARRLMRSAAYAWARNQGINLSCDKSVPFKADAKLVRNLYAGLRFFAQQQFAALDAQAHTDKYDGTNAEF